MLGKGVKFWSLILVGGALAASAAPGDLDRTFAGTGSKVFGFGSGDDYPHAMAVQADNKLVIAGNGNSFEGEVILARLNPDGSLDTTFGAAGKVVTRLAAGQPNVAAVKIQTDG